MRILAINDEVRARIKTAMERARMHPLHYSVFSDALKPSAPPLVPVINLKDIKPGFKRPVKSQRVRIPFGYDVCYSVEEQPDGLAGHISISVVDVGMMPSPEATERIASEFGITIPPDKAWIEEFAPGHYAVNVVSLLK